MSKHVYTRLLWWVLLAAFLLGLGCAGGGSGTGNANTIAGQILAGNGNGVAKAKVSLYESHSVPILPGDTGNIEVDYTSTDTSGNYTFTDIPQGQYNLEARDSTQTLRHFTLDVTVGPRDHVWVGYDTLGPTKEFVANVTNPQPVPTYCFVYGSPYIAGRNDTTGLFVLPNLPVGSYDIQFKTFPDTAVSCSASYQVGQLPDTTVVLRITLECQ